MPAMPPDLTIRERTDAYIHARYQHPAWLLLGSRRGPLVLSCLRGLFEDRTPTAHGAASVSRRKWLTTMSF